MGKIGLRPGGGHGCRLKEGGGVGKWTPVTGPMYGPHCQPFFFYYAIHSLIFTYRQILT